MRQETHTPKKGQSSMDAESMENSPPSQNVDRAMAKGALWMILARIGDRSLGFVSMIFLVRLLAPADFGLVAMGMSVIALCELFGQVGFDITLIQNPQATRRHYDTAWTFTVLLSIFTAAVLMAAAFPATKFYDEPRLLPILLCLAAGSLISGFENIGIVAFRKDLQFNKEFRFLFGKKLAGFLITVPLALFLRSYWALVVGIVVTRLVGVWLSYRMQEYRPRWSFEARHELFHFSKWLAISNLVTVVNARSADFIVGKIAGAHALGLFSISYELSNLPTSELIAPINRAVFPGYARKSSDGIALKEGYLSVVSVIAAFGVPAGVGIAATAGWLVPLLFGRQWTEAIPLVSILALYGILAAMKTNAHYVYLALGKPQVATYLGVAQMSLLLPSLVVLSLRSGAAGAAFGYLISQAVFTPISFTVLFNVLDIRLRELLAVLWRPVFSAAIMFVTIRFAIPLDEPMLVDNLVAVTHLLSAVITGVIAYVTCLYALWSVSGRPVGAESGFLTVLKLIWGRCISFLGFTDESGNRHLAESNGSSDRKPRVSIGLPVHNGERYLEACLGSLLAQTHTDFELIVSDNASTDRTEEICRRYAAKDPRVRYYRNATNIGVGRNFNRVFLLSRGDYFKWASADDVCQPEHLERCLGLLESDDGAVLAYPKTRFIDETGTALDINDPGWDLRSDAAHERLRYVICAGHWVNPHYGLIRAEALAETRLMPSYPGGDYRVLAELSLRGRFVEVPEYLFLRRVHPGASSQNTAKLGWVMEFHTGDATSMCLPFWDLIFDYFVIIIKSRLGIRHKLSVLGLLARRMWWGHRRLLQELGMGAAFYWHRLDSKSTGKQEAR